VITARLTAIAITQPGKAIAPAGRLIAPAPAQQQRGQGGHGDPGRHPHWRRPGPPGEAASASGPAGGTGRTAAQDQPSSSSAGDGARGPGASTEAPHGGHARYMPRLRHMPGGREARRGGRPGHGTDQGHERGGYRDGLRRCPRAARRARWPAGYSILPDSQGDNRDQDETTAVPSRPRRSTTMHGQRGYEARPRPDRHGAWLTRRTARNVEDTRAADAD